MTLLGNRERHGQGQRKLKDTSGGLFSTVEEHSMEQNRIDDEPQNVTGSLDFKNWSTMHKALVLLLSCRRSVFN